MNMKNKRRDLVGYYVMCKYSNNKKAHNFYRVVKKSYFQSIPVYYLENKSSYFPIAIDDLVENYKVVSKITATLLGDL